MRRVPSTLANVRAAGLARGRRVFGRWRVVGLAGLALAALASLAFSAAQTSAFTSRTKNANLSLLHIGRDGRTLVFNDSYGGCEGPARVRRVRESRSSVTIVARRREAVPEDTGKPNEFEGCPGVLRGRKLRVRLRHPVRGRRILGTGRIGFGSYQVLPRVVGLAPTDARRLLRAQDYRTRIVYIGRDRFPSRVAGQSPAPGKASPGRNPRVTLYVRR